MSDEKAEQTLRAILDHWTAQRGVGHTAMLLRGAAYTGGFVVAADARHARQLQEESRLTCLRAERAPEYSARFVSLHALPEMLRMGGYHGPLAVDHYAMSHLLHPVLSKIDALRAENKRLREALRRLVGDCTAIGIQKPRPIVVRMAQRIIAEAEVEEADDG